MGNGKDSGCNQLTASGGTSLGYDTKGNLTSSGSDSFGYNSENLLTSATVASVSTTNDYDPLMRLFKSTSSSMNSRFQYDGTEVAAIYDNSGTLAQRFVSGPGADEVLVEYDGSGVRSFQHADERGSVVARSDSSGAKTAINSYDDYRIPASTNVGRFQYTGQMLMPTLGMYYYIARFYSPTLGRFLQSDPVGYGDGLNFYAYVRNDTINFRDPSGLCSQEDGWEDCEITVTGHRRQKTFCQKNPGNQICQGSGGTPRQPSRPVNPPPPEPPTPPP